MSTESQRQLAVHEGSALAELPTAPTFRVGDGAQRLLTPAARRRPRFPKWTAAALGAAVVSSIFASWVTLPLTELVQALAALVAVFTAIRLAAWSEDRLYTWFVGRHGALRVGVALLAPLLGLIVLVPLAAILGGLIERIGGDGIPLVSFVLASLWFTSAAVGSAVVALIDIAVSAVVKQFRTRVQLAVLGLLLMTSGVAVTVYGVARFFASRLGDIDASAIPSFIKAKVAQDGGNPDDVNLAFNEGGAADVAKFLARPEVADIAALGLFAAVAAISFPAVLSAAGKIAEAVMERLHPLSEGFASIAGGDLTVRLEEAGSNDFVRISRGFNKMTDNLADAVTALDARNQELVDINVATQRFVPFPFLQLLGKQSIRQVTRGDHVALDISVLFSDIRGFTTFAEAEGAESTFGFINRYLSYMEPEIHERKGFINDFFGDGIMALFQGDADAAVQSAIGMSKALAAFNRELAEENAPPIRIGMGLHTGRLMLGTIGGRDRLDCTVIGDPANLASRVEGMTKLYGATLLVTESTVSRLRDQGAYRLREVDRVRVKGKKEPVTVYEVLDAESVEVAASKDATMNAFQTALRAYRSSSFEEARSGFETCLASAPDDGASKLYVDRCTSMIERGAPDSWAGVTDLLSK